MTIYRLSIEPIHGDDNSRLDELRTAVRSTPGVVLYDEDATEGWGVPFREGVFHVDFDSSDSAGRDVDRVVFEKVLDFVLHREDS